MKYKIKYPQKRASDKWAITGKYYLIDGILHIEMSSKDEMGLHKEMFEKIKQMYPQYKDYHYLYFPRGAVMFDDLSKVSYISGPEDLDESQRYRIGRSFEAFKLEWEFDEHYNWPYIELDIKQEADAADWDEDTLKLEIEYTKEGFYEQIRKFKGVNKAIYI